MTATDFKQLEVELEVEGEVYGFEFLRRDNVDWWFLSNIENDTESHFHFIKDDDGKDIMVTTQVTMNWEIFDLHILGPHHMFSQILLIHDGKFDMDSEEYSVFCDWAIRECVYDFFSQDQPSNQPENTKDFAESCTV